MKRFLVVPIVIVAACTPTLEMMTRNEAISFCQNEAREAAGPTGTASVGVNSVSGPSFGLSLNFSDAYLRGLSPEQVFENCMSELAANGQIVEGI